MLRFPMRDAMSTEQATANNMAQQVLTRGKYYRFLPPITATAVPVGGPNTCALEECIFERGWYLGYVDGNHVFQGKPVNDQRVIPTPAGCEEIPNLDEVLEQLRDSYFHVLFIGGNKAILDTNQNH